MHSHISSDRRQFIASLTTALVGLGTSSAFSQSQKKDAGAEVLGQGKYQWRVVPDWGVLDAETPVKDCHAMLQTGDGRIFLLTNHTKNNVIIYDKSGKLLGKWGSEYPGAHGFRLRKEAGEEIIYITDHDLHRFFKTTLDGKVLRTWEFPEKSGKYKEDKQFKPTDIAFAPDGGFYVVDGYGQNWCHHYDAEGNYVKSFGGNESGGANLVCAHGAWVDTRGKAPLLWITSRTESKIKRYTLDGTLVDVLEFPGAQPNFIVPFGDLTLVPHLRGNTHAKDQPQNGFLSILDPERKIIANLAAPAPEYIDGKPAPLGADTLLFTFPHGILIDDEESIYIAQWNSGRTYPIKLERVKS